MPQAANEVVIERPPNEVFAFLANPENGPQWRRGVIELTHVAGEGVGASYAQKVSGPGGRPIAADIEVTEYEPDRALAFRTTSGPVRPRGRYTLSPEGAGTRVRFELEAETKGLKRLLAPMVQKTMSNEVQALERLKEVLES
jgi:uncharacterized protein YndB with AHSA1/START domain